MLLEVLPVSLDLALLKLRLPELVLRPGMSVVARVASRGEGASASLVLAGALLKASVPEEVRTGDTLRLTVAETSAERVVLRLESSTPSAPPPAAAPVADPSAAALAASPPPPAPLHADAEAEASGRGQGQSRAAVSLSYETPALGRLDLRLERGPEGVSVVVGVPAGSFGLAQERAETLRQALETRLNTQASVRIAPRREPFDAYA
jgi:hypothetical protein